MTVYLLSIGLISILGQVILLRELNVSFYGVELIYLFALGIWLFWTAVGVIAGRRMALPSRHSPAVLFILFGMILFLDVAFIRSSRLIFGGVPGAYLDFFQQLLVATLSILPVGLLSGLLFQQTAGLYVDSGRTLAAAYAVESAGGLIGGLFSTLLIILDTQNLFAALICSIVSFATPLLGAGKSLGAFLRRTAIVLLAMFAGLIFNASPLHDISTRWNHPNLLDSSDSPYGRITVTRMFDQISVFENDALSFETEGTDAEYFCHLVMLQHPHPRKILILGGGMEGIIGEALKYRPDHIDYVEINPVMTKLVMEHLPESIRQSLQSPEVRIIYADPRRYLTNSGRYDLILVGMPEPSSGQANRFYTQEFFKQCAAKLKSGGLLGFKLQTAENLWTGPLIGRNASIYHALRSVFPAVLFLPGTTNIVTASFAPLPDTPDIMTGRLQHLQLETRLISDHYIRYLFTNDRFAAVKNLLNEKKDLLNSDIRPVCYQYALIIWLSKFFPRATLFYFSSIMEKTLLRYLPVCFLMVLPVLFLVSRFLPGLRRKILVAAAGFAGIALETILLLYFQLKYGVIYRDIGLLLMSFMAGLALGALAVDKLMARFADHRLGTRRCGIILVAGSCCLCAITALLIRNSLPAGLWLTGLLLTATGFIVSGIFAYASLYEIDDQRAIISPLYAADLIGGCLGSVLVSLIFIPLAGMDTTMWGMLLLSVYAFLLL